MFDALRQPMEDGTTHLSRAGLALVYPARFMLVGAMNPCPCGFHGTGAARCICSEPQVRRHFSRIAGPLLDRIDLHIEVGALDQQELSRRNVELPRTWTMIKPKEYEESGDPIPPWLRAQLVKQYQASGEPIPEWLRGPAAKEFLHEITGCG